MTTDNGAAHANPDPPFPASLRYLKDSIHEVAFANHFLAGYERDLREIAPPSLGVPAEAHGPETPAERADRLLQAHALVSMAVEEDLARIQPAVANLKSCGISDLEESVMRSRRLLAEEFIAPNLEVLSLDQDGGIASPFKDRTPEEIIALLMEEPPGDERRMHEAERVLRSCPAVRELQRDFRKLVALRADPASKRSLEEARHAADQCARTWGIASPGEQDAPSFSAHLSALSRLHAELERKHARLEALKPRLIAYLGARSGLSDLVRPIVGTLLEKEAGRDVATLFEDGMPLAQLASRHGFLPVAQVFRELVAAAIDAGAAGSGWNGFPEAISALIRHRVQGSVFTADSVGAAVTQLAVALCNQGIARDLTDLATRLGQIPERERHEIIDGAEAARRVQETLARAEARVPGNGRARGETNVMSNGVATLFARLGRRLRSEELLVDASELNGLLDTTLDYLRRRHAFHEQAAARAAYIERGWTARSRQRRMEKPLGDEIPTLLELSQIDAELTEVFQFIQEVADAFPHSEESPLTSILSTLAAREKEVCDTVAGAPESLRELLTDAQRSPVVTEFIRLMERLRQNSPDGEGSEDVIAALARELARVAELARECEPAGDAEAALALCRKTGLAPLELAGLVTSDGTTLPLARYASEVFQAEAAGTQGTEGT